MSETGARALFDLLAAAMCVMFALGWISEARKSERVKASTRVLRAGLDDGENEETWLRAARAAEGLPEEKDDE